MGLIQERRDETDKRLADLRKGLAAAEERIADKGCVYLTGSFARGEATSHSDLDLFIVGRTGEVEAKPVRVLKRLDEICIKAALIEQTRAAKIPEFSGDGEYLVHYGIADLVSTLGRPEDDANNTFTARMLLLLESRPLLGSTVRTDAVDAVLAAYWRDYADHQHDFVPAFLANDILRMWRTFCVRGSDPDRARSTESQAQAEELQAQA